MGHDPESIFQRTGIRFAEKCFASMRNHAWPGDAIQIRDFRKRRSISVAWDCGLQTYALDPRNSRTVAQNAPSQSWRAKRCSSSTSSKYFVARHAPRVFRSKYTQFCLQMQRYGLGEF